MDLRYDTPLASTGIVNVLPQAGDLGVNGGRIPLMVASGDGGVRWKATPIGNYGSFAGPQGTVTALAAGRAGFLAAGLISKQGAQQAVTWTSADGVTWSAPMPASGGTQAITALSADGNAVTKISILSATHGNRSVAVTAPAS